MVRGGIMCHSPFAFTKAGIREKPGYEKRPQPIGRAEMRLRLKAIDERIASAMSRKDADSVVSLCHERAALASLLTA